jgi:uncharacterized membrane protein YhhN
VTTAAFVMAHTGYIGFFRLLSGTSLTVVVVMTIFAAFGLFLLLRRESPAVSVGIAAGHGEPED